MSNRMKIPKICQHCGKTFIAQTTVTKFCGDTCAKRNYKKRAKDAKIEQSLIETRDQILSPNIQSVNQSSMPKEYLSINEISDMLGVSRWTINRMVGRGEIIAKQMGRKKIISRKSIEAFFN